MNADRLLSQLLSSGAGAGLAGGLAGGLASGLLTSKAGRRLGRKAARLGGLAAVAGLAYAAFRRYREGAGAPDGPAPANAPEPAGQALARAGFLPAPGSADADALGRRLLRVMIAAAHADGRLDPAERGAIFERVARLELPASDTVELWDELERPVDLATLASDATSRELASELYAAALLAIDVDTEAERAWLAQLAERLALPEPLVEALHREAGAPPAAPARPVVAA
jgi:uncharacterized membrane protein YebE (DUF533 family)